MSIGNDHEKPFFDLRDIKEHINAERHEDRFIHELIAREQWHFSPNIEGKLLLLAKRRREAPHIESEIMSHLYDTREIIGMVPHDIRMAALLHDIGKSGPSECAPDTVATQADRAAVQKLVAVMFAYPFRVEKKYDHTPTVSDLLDALFSNREHVKLIKIHIDRAQAEKLLGLIDVSPDDDVMSGFFRRHVEWGAQVLQKELHNPDTSLTARDAWIALNHHRFFNNQSIEIEGFQPQEQDQKNAFILEIIDVYQARRRRGNENHTDALKNLRTRFENRMTKLQKTDILPYTHWFEDAVRQIELTHEVIQ